jgi:hypothetical protein
MQPNLTSLLLFVSLFIGLAISDSVCQRRPRAAGVKIVSKPRLEDPYGNERILEDGQAPMVSLTRGKRYKVEIQGPNSPVWYVVIGKQVTSDEKYWMKQIAFASDERKKTEFSTAGFDKAMITVWVSPNKFEKGSSWLLPVPYLKGTDSGQAAGSGYVLEFKDKLSLVRVMISPRKNRK